MASADFGNCSAIWRQVHQERLVALARVELELADRVRRRLQRPHLLGDGGIAAADVLVRPHQVGGRLDLLAEGGRELQHRRPLVHQVLGRGAEVQLEHHPLVRLPGGRQHPVGLRVVLDVADLVRDRVVERLGGRLVRGGGLGGGVLALDHPVEHGDQGGHGGQPGDDQRDLRRQPAHRHGDGVQGLGRLLREGAHRVGAALHLHDEVLRLGPTFWNAARIWREPRSAVAAVRSMASLALAAPAPTRRAPPRPLADGAQLLHDDRAVLHREADGAADRGGHRRLRWRRGRGRGRCRARWRRDLITARWQVSAPLPWP